MAVEETFGEYNSPEALKAAIFDLLMEKATYLTLDKIAEFMGGSKPGDVYPEKDLPQQIEALFTLLTSQIGQDEASNFFRQQILPMKGSMHPKFFNFIEAGVMAGQWDHHLF